MSRVRRHERSSSVPESQQSFLTGVSKPCPTSKLFYAAWPFPERRISSPPRPPSPGAFPVYFRYISGTFPGHAGQVLRLFLSSRGLLGASLHISYHFGAIWGHVWPFGPIWGYLVASGGHLGPSGAFGEHLGVVAVRYGRLGNLRGGIWGAFGAI